MAVNLQKGQKISLKKSDGRKLTRLMVGLGWDAANKKKSGFFSTLFGTNESIDCDASVFLCRNGKFVDNDDLVYFGNLEHHTRAVKHMGDNLTGEGEGDDEEIKVDLDKVPANVEKIDFTVTIYDAEARRQTFGQVSNAYIRVVDDMTGKEIIRYDLGEDFSVETAVVVGEIYRNRGEWKFNAIGAGWSGGLAALGKNYGVNV